MSFQEAKQIWKQCFYEDEYNIAIRGFKKLCRWVMLHVPDASMAMGLPRYMLNFVVIIVTATAVGFVLFTARNPLELLLGLYLASWVPGLVFIRSVAAAIYWGIEKYQGLMRGMLEKDSVTAQAGRELFEV